MTERPETRRCHGGRALGDEGLNLLCGVCHRLMDWKCDIKMETAQLGGVECDL